MENVGDVPDATNGAPTVSRVAIKPPPFYRNNTKLWFAQLEAQFKLSNISNSETMYYHCLSLLPEDVAEYVTLDDTTSYADIKKQVMQAYQKSKSLKMEEALSSLDISGMRPSIAIQRLQRSFTDAGITADEDLIKHRLMQSLPMHLKSTIAGHQHLKLADFGGIADSIFDVANVHHVAHVSTTAVRQQHQQPLASPSPSQNRTHIERSNANAFAVRTYFMER
jgi:hypothetical protein